MVQSKILNFKGKINSLFGHGHLGGKIVCNLTRKNLIYFERNSHFWRPAVWDKNPNNYTIPSLA